MYYDMRIIRNIENKNKKWLTGCVLNINKYFFCSIHCRINFIKLF